jgi:hypothetical protein
MTLEEIQSILSGVRTHIFMGSADQGDAEDLDMVSAEIGKIREEGVAAGKESTVQVLLTLQSCTAPDAPWADKAVHEFVTAVLKGKQEKSQLLIDILK